MPSIANSASSYNLDFWFGKYIIHAMPRLENENLRKITESAFNSIYFVRIGQEIYSDRRKNNAAIEDEMRNDGIRGPVVDEGILTRLNEDSILVNSFASTKPEVKRPTQEQLVTDRLIEKIAGNDVKVFDTTIYNRQRRIIERNLKWCVNHRRVRNLPAVFRPRTFMKP